MNSHKKYYFILIFLVSVAGSSAQISFDNPQIINSKSGLPTDRTSAVIKDDQGFIWISTLQGICRWDGIDLKVFQHTNDSNSISGDFITPNNFIWDSLSKQIIIGTDNGLSFFDPEKLTSHNIIDTEDEPTTFLSSIHVVYLDRQGMLWIGSDKGLNFRQRDGKLIPFITNRKSQYNKNWLQYIFDIKQDLSNDSVLWIATLQGIVKLNKYSKEIKHFYNDVENFSGELNTFNKIITHSNGKLYFRTWNTDMVVFNTNTEKFELLFGPCSSSKFNFFPVPVIPFFQKSENELWVSSKKGIGIFNTQTNKIQILHKFVNEAGNGYLANIAFIEPGEAMWLTSEYGVTRINMKKQLIQNFFFEPVDENYWFLPTSFYEDTAFNKLYLGYARGLGLHYFNLRTNTFHVIPIPKKQYNEIIVRDIFPIDEKTLFILSPDEIYKLSRDKEEMVPLSLNCDKIPNLTSIASDNEGKIWISGSKISLFQLNENSREIKEAKNLKKYFKEKDVPPSIKKTTIDKYNNIWFSNNESYGYYNPGNGNLHFFDDTKKLIVLCFYRDKTDTIWVGLHENGLGFINPNEPENGVQIYNQKFRKSVFSLQRASNNTFYCLTPDGIEKLSTKNDIPQVFDEKNGLVKYDKWSNRDPSLGGELFKLKDGRLGIVYRRGLGLFHPDSLIETIEDIIPYISLINVFDKKISIEGKLFSSRKLELNYDQNFLSIEFSALALNSGSKIFLSHQLSGVDKNLVSSKNRIVNYANLQPGSYRFIVKAENQSNPGQVKEAFLDIVIHPPWWKTWWAYSVFLLLFLLIIVAIYRFQLKRELTRKETERLKDLDKLKSHLYANITHEFRTPLTVIKGMTGEIIDKLTKAEQKRFDSKLEMIERNSDKLLHLVKQMLDMSKIEDGKMKLNLIQDNIVSYLQYVLESFQSMAAAKDIKLMFYHETEEIIMDYDEDKVFKIASNLLSNAIKFTPESGKIIFHVKKEKTGEMEKLVIKVKDSGIGIEPKDLPYVFDRFYQVDNSRTRKGEGTGIGLTLTKELVLLMDGRITVKSQPGRWTEFCVSIPISNQAILQKAKPEAIQIIEGPVVSSLFEPETKENKHLPMALVIEDNTDVAKYIRICLSGKYRVHWSPDGQQGIDTAISTIPDIIISDVMMPVKDGFEVCETLKQDERTSHIPIILLTAKATNKDLIEGLSHGADVYLTKPFNKEELFIRLNQLIKIRRQLQERYSKIGNQINEKEEPTREDIFLKKAIEIINKNLDNPNLDNSKLASELALSESQLYRKLKAISGKSTAIFIRTVKLNIAKELLTTSNLSVSEIAYQLGFNDPAWFSRVFKEEFGVSPSSIKR